MHSILLSTSSSSNSLATTCSDASRTLLPFRRRTPSRAVSYVRVGESLLWCWVEILTALKLDVWSMRWLVAVCEYSIESANCTTMSKDMTHH